MEFIESVFTIVVQAAILLLESIGVAILVVTAIKSAINLLKKQPGVKIQLAEGTALALEFKLGSEVLRTVIVRTWDELAILGAIVLLRAAITLLIQWNLKSERAIEEI